MIVVTGANGQLGRGVIEGLLTRVPANRIVASVRDPSQAKAFCDKGVLVRAGDFAEPVSLATAFAGAELVLIVSPDKLGDEGRRLSRAAIAAARAAGARRVLYTSHMGTHADSPFNDHAAIEDDLARTGMPFTSLRHGFYAESAFHLVGRGFETGEIRVPEDGPVSWTARADLAAADAAVLAEDGKLDGISPALTAREAFTMADLVTIASDVTGRKIKRTIVSDAEWRGEKVAAGVPAPMADALLKVFRDARDGVYAATDPTLETLLGRRPRTMRDVLAAALEPAA